MLSRGITFRISFVKKRVFVSRDRGKEPSKMGGCKVMLSCIQTYKYININKKG